MQASTEDAVTSISRIAAEVQKLNEASRMIAAAVEEQSRDHKTDRGTCIAGRERHRKCLARCQPDGDCDS